VFGLPVFGWSALILLHGGRWRGHWMVWLALVDGGAARCGWEKLRESGVEDLGFWVNHKVHNDISVFFFKKKFKKASWVNQGGRRDISFHFKILAK
jgi:hypothetical protein